MSEAGQATAFAEADAPVVALVEVSEAVVDPVDDTKEVLEVEELEVEAATEEDEEDEPTSFAPQMLGETPAAPRTFFR